MNTWKKLSALLAASALAFAITGTALAVTYATVDGHEAHSAAANEASYWGEDCTKVEFGGEDTTYELEANYGLVVVKSGAGEFANTIFEDVTAGETVFADTNGNFAFDDGDQGISHIIFCDEQEEESEEPSFEQSEEAETEEPSDVPSDEPSDVPSDEPSFEQSQEAETEEPSDVPSDEPSFEQSVAADTEVPTEPPTNTIGGGTSGPADGAWLLVVALGVFLASVVVLTPARAKVR